MAQKMGAASLPAVPQGFLGWMAALIQLCLGGTGAVLPRSYSCLVKTSAGSQWGASAPFFLGLLESSWCGAGSSQS